MFKAAAKLLKGLASRAIPNAAHLIRLEHEGNLVLGRLERTGKKIERITLIDNIVGFRLQRFFQPSRSRHVVHYFRKFEECIWQIATDPLPDSLHTACFYLHFVHWRVARSVERIDTGRRKYGNAMSQLLKRMDDADDMYTFCATPLCAVMVENVEWPLRMLRHAGLPSYSSS